MKKGTRGEAAIRVEAPPNEVYALVSDVTRMGEWSPETTSAEWVDGATGPEVGAHFKGRNRHGIARWSTTPRVVAAEPGREFAFATTWLGKDNTQWTYRFEPDGDGTRVTESFEMLVDVPWYFTASERLLMGVKDRKADLEAAMAKTLERLKATVEGSPTS
jgi:uncharacterized protein YndB with AHSA1/START domain